MKINEYAGIVLCAGFSSRFKLWKPSVLIDNTPLIFHSVKPMLKVCCRVILVGGHNIENLRLMFNENPYFSPEELSMISIVENIGFQNGMFSSVKLGIKSLLEKYYKGVFIVPGDMPVIREETYLTIKDMSEIESFDVIIPAIKKEAERLFLSKDSECEFVKGHPIMISDKVIEKIRTEDETKTLREVIRSFNQKLVVVEDKGICLDVDNESDLKNVLVYLHTKEKQE